MDGKYSELRDQSSSDVAACKEVNYLVQHWRGDLSLATSYWVNGVIGGIGFKIAVDYFGYYCGAQVSPIVGGLAFLALILLFAVWQIVGIWRSASYHVERGGSSEWAGLAKVVAVVWIFGLSMTLNTTVKRIVELTDVPLAAEARSALQPSISGPSQNQPATQELDEPSETSQRKFRVIKIEEAQGRFDKSEVETLVRLGWDYRVGNGVPVDLVESARCYRKAAELGAAEAQHNLGVCYYNGDGVQKDSKEAVKWCRLAASQGMPAAQSALGQAYHDGEGVQQDFQEAVKWWRKAAIGGDAGAQRWLGMSYVRGEGVPQDDVAAARWWYEAAKQGDPTAQLNLAECYWRGRGTPKNWIEAHKWLGLAIAQANPVDGLVLQGLSGAGGRTLASINGVTFANGEAATVRSSFGEISIKCLNIQSNCARILIENETAEHTIWLKPDVSDGNSDVFRAAADFKSKLEARMSRADINEAQRRAAAFEASEDGREAETDERTPAPRSGQGQIAVGTGFFVTGDGYLVTCEHVVRGATAIRVKTAGRTLSAMLVRQNRVIDLALLKVEGGFQPLPIASKPPVTLGDSVFTVGFPNPDLQGERPKLTRGEISGLSGIRDHPRYFQISVPVQPGNSGGALVDEYGNVVGVVTARLDDVATYELSGALPQNVNYALKSDILRTFLGGVPEVASKFKAPHAIKDRSAASVAAERAAVLVIAE